MLRRMARAEAMPTASSSTAPAVAISTSGWVVSTLAVSESRLTCALSA